MRKNKALAKLRAGGITSGPGMVTGSPDVAEMIAHMGFEWAWMDWQHGQWTELTVNNAIARFLAVETSPIVRVKGHEQGTINRVLDMGAMGVIVPMVQNADDARKVAAACYYPPVGMRSGGGIRLGFIGDDGDYFERANDEIMLIVMVETEEAIANVTEIMQVPTVDAVLIGPGDLMIDVKANGNDEAYHEELVIQVAEAGKETGTAAGYVCQGREQLEKRQEQGFRLLMHGYDSAILQQGFAQIKADIEGW
jgi:4-hydroxy-2-oxoheptanedioate aldolase